MSWTVNGQTYTTTAVSGNIDRLSNGSFNIGGKSTSGSQVDEVSMGTTYSFGGIGTYNLNTIYSGAGYQRTTGGITTFIYQCGSTGSSGGPGSGNLIVTQYDETAGTAAGTFGFMGVSSMSSATATITNGTFSIKF